MPASLRTLDRILESDPRFLREGLEDLARYGDRVDDFRPALQHLREVSNIVAQQERSLKRISAWTAATFIAMLIIVLVGVGVNVFAESLQLLSATAGPILLAGAAIAIAGLLFTRYTRALQLRRKFEHEVIDRYQELLLERSQIAE